MNKIFFENGINHELTAEEIKLLRLLLSEHGRETVEEHGIDINSLVALKTLFVEHLD